MKLKNILKFGPRKNKILVISGGGFRGVYAVGILKGLEKLGIDKEIEAIFGVSIGAIVGSLRANGIPAEKIYELLSGITFNKFYGKDIFTATGGMLSNKKIKQMINENLPDNFSKLKKKMYVGAVDTNTAKYILFNKGNIREIILGSMSIPGAFPPVNYLGHSLVDGGVLNNFPVDLAKKLYPKKKIIGIALNKFKKNQEIKTFRDNLSINFEILLRSKLLENTKYVDFLFYKQISIGVLSLDKKKMATAYERGYKDCLEMFK